MVSVLQPVAVGQSSVHQSSQDNHGTEEMNALTLFAIDSHNHLLAQIFHLALVM